MRRATALLLVALVAAAIVAAIFWFRPPPGLSDVAVGAAPAPMMRATREAQTMRLVWSEQVTLAGVQVVAPQGSTVRLEVGGEPIDAQGDLVWLDAACGEASERPVAGACRTALVHGEWDGPVGQLSPIYAGTRVFWRGLGPRALELLVAYGVRPLAQAPSDLRSLREGDVLIVPRPAEFATAARVVALAPSQSEGERRDVPSLRALAVLRPDDEGLRVALAVDGVPIVFAQGRDLRPTIDLVATVDALRFGWGPGGVDTDGNGEVQPRDRFPGLRESDVAQPVADMLVASVLAEFLRDDEPRISWVPAGAPALLVLTADQDYAPLAAVEAQSAAAGSAGLTVLLTTPRAGRAADVNFRDAPDAMLGPSALRNLLGRGHGLGVHPFVEAAPTGVTRAVAGEFEALYGRRPRVIRNHHVTWHGADLSPRAQSEAGLRLGLDYIAQSSAGSDLGFMGGTGVPMRYPNAGTLQLPTQLDDHVLLPARFGYRAYDLAALNARTDSVLDAAVRHGCVVVANHHPIWWIETEGAWQRHLIASAHRRGMPVWGATEYLAYAMGARDAVVFKDVDRGWMALVPATGLSVVLDGVSYELSPGVQPVRDGGRPAQK